MIFSFNNITKIGYSLIVAELHPMAMPKDDVVVRTCNKAYIGYGLKVECGQQWPARRYGFTSSAYCTV